MGDVIDPNRLNSNEIKTFSTYLEFRAIILYGKVPDDLSLISKKLSRYKAFTEGLGSIFDLGCIEEQFRENGIDYVRSKKDPKYNLITRKTAHVLGVEPSAIIADLRNSCGLPDAIAEFLGNGGMSIVRDSPYLIPSRPVNDDATREQMISEHFVYTMGGLDHVLRTHVSDNASLIKAMHAAIGVIDDYREIVRGYMPPFSPVGNILYEIAVKHIEADGIPGHAITTIPAAPQSNFDDDGPKVK